MEHLPGYVTTSAYRLGGSENRSVLAYVVVGLAGLIGPAMIAAYFLFMPDRLADVLFLSVGGLVLTLVVPVFIVRKFRSISAQRARVRKLSENGIPAIAEIIGRIEIRLDEGTNLGLTMSFAGPDMEPFVASVECNAEDSLVVGARFNALVDPADNQFRILR